MPQSDNDNSKGILIAGIVTGATLMSLVVLALTGVFEKLGLYPTLAIAMGEMMTIGVFWLLALTGRLGGGGPKG
jgi:hypothetical protein